MTATVTLGIDIGTTGTKVVAFDAADGRLLAVSRSVRAHTDGPGIAEADGAEWIDNTISAIGDLIAHHGVDPRRVAAISTTGMVPAVVALDDVAMPCVGGSYRAMLGRSTRSPPSPSSSRFSTRSPPRVARSASSRSLRRCCGCRLTSPSCGHAPVSSWAVTTGC